MKHLILILGVLVLFLFAGSAQSANHSWSFKADDIEACSCSAQVGEDSFPFKDRTGFFITVESSGTVKK